MKKLLILFSIFLLFNCAEVRRSIFVPAKIEGYCGHILGKSDNHDAINTCIMQERSAKDELSRMIIPPHIEKRCRQLSVSTGGSYQVMLTCVQQEMPGKKRGK